MPTNMIPNGSFENDTSWSFFGSSDTPKYVSEKSHDGNRSLRCTQITTGQTFQAMNDLVLAPGKTYRVQFYAEFEQAGTLTVNFNFLPIAGGGTLYLYTIPSAETTTGLKTFEFTVPASSSATIGVRLVIYTSSLSGYSMKNVWLDAFEMFEVLPYETWALGYIALPQTHIRKQPNTNSDYWIRLDQGTPLAVKSLSATSDWYLTTCGQEPAEAAYVMAANVVNIDATMPWYERIVEIAEFYVGKNKADLLLENKWCQSFANVCVAQAGLADNNPWVNKSNCADVWDLIQRVTTPSKGCLVFTKNQQEDTVSHVALVVSDIASNGDFDVIEGDYNGSSVVTRRPTPMNVSNSHIVGFGRPLDQA